MVAASETIFATHRKTDDNHSKRVRAKVHPAIRVSIVEDDAPARGILTGWIRSAAGFECLGGYEHAEAALVAALS
jgi:hypothetical protein